MILNSTALLACLMLSLKKLECSCIYRRKRYDNIESGSKSYILNYRGNPQFNRPDKEWNVVAVETFQGVNYVADLNKSESILVVHEVDKDWNFTGNHCEYAEIRSDSWRYQFAELVFQMDFDDDELIAGGGLISCTTCFLPAEKNIVTDTCGVSKLTTICIFTTCSYTSGSQANNNWRTYQGLVMSDINII